MNLVKFEQDYKEEIYHNGYKEGWEGEAFVTVL